MIIYKITNTINGKVYIGLTKSTLKHRYQKHVIESKNLKNQKHLYRAMRKYSIDNFRVEKIDEANSTKELGEKERYYIKLYDSTNPIKGYNLTHGGERHQYDGNSQSKLKVADVEFIRTKYAECLMSVKECWLKYFPQMSYSGFQKVWDGNSWKGIMDYVYTPENIRFHKSQVACKGEKNANAKYTDKEVMEIRFYYVNHTLKETYQRFNKYGESIKNSFRSLIDSSYRHLPLYSKVRKTWLLNNQPYDISQYKPVSTISESGE